MQADPTNYCEPEFRLIGDSQILHIHHSVLRILDEVGGHIYPNQAIDLLICNGARIEADNVVQIPSFSIEEAIDSAPSSLVICNRDKAPVIELGEEEIFLGTETDLPKTIDLNTIEIRDTKSEDIIDSVIISDAMLHIDIGP